MDYDLIAIFWTFVVFTLFTIGLRRLTQKKPTNKRWVRPEKKSDDLEK